MNRQETSPDGEDVPAYAFAAFGLGRGTRVVIRRRGRFLLMVPRPREAAARTLGLYQPQQPVARLGAAGLRVASLAGLHGLAGRKSVVPALSQDCLVDGVDGDSLGLLLGDPAHKVPRGIASYRRGGDWEVAKVALGPLGREILAHEAGVLTSLAGKGRGVPELLGLHRGGIVTLLRMSYMVGRPLAARDLAGVVELLTDWLSPCAARMIGEFPEWPAICSALGKVAGGVGLLERLGGMTLVPALRHGDFARWNMRRGRDGSLMVLDWEWGNEAGLPGLDLVHFLAQDARLVKKLPPALAWSEVEASLERPIFREYLARTGWGKQIPLLMAACFAFKEGAAHQDCADMVEECCRRESCG